MLLRVCCDIRLPSVYASVSLEALSVTVIKKVMTAPEVSFSFIIWIWNRNCRGNCVNDYTHLFSETWSWSEKLKMSSNVLSGVQAAFISDILMEQSRSLASREVPSAIWDAVEHPDGAGRYNVGPVGELLTSEVDRGRLAMVPWSISDDTPCLCTANGSWLNCLCTTGFLKLMKFKASPVVAKHNVKLVSKSIVIQQRMYLVLIGMLYLIKLVFSIQKRIWACLLN